MEELDRSFAEALIKQKLASREQVAECIEAVREAIGLGAQVNLPDAMVKKGYISREQADALLAKIRSARSKVTSLGGYELLGKLGGDAIGAVYKAREPSTGRTVAIEVLKPALSRDTAFAERFVAGARTAAGLHHPNIVETLGAGRDKGYNYRVTEYPDGPTLAERLQESGPIPGNDALKMALGLAAALAEAERAGIVHGDVNPGNILLARDGTPKLAGLGRPKPPAAAAPGAAHYVSPEQARGGAMLDARSDIYSLGATLYNIVVGSPPFEGATPAQIISKRLSEPPPDPRASRPEVSFAVSNLIMRMMAKDPGDRYATALELLNMIETLTGAETSQGAPPLGGQTGITPSWTSNRRRQVPKAAIVAGACAVALAAVVAIVIASRKPEPAPVENTAQRAYAEAAAYRKDHPEDLSGAISRFRKIETQYPNTAWADRAVGKIQELKDKQKELADQNAGSTVDAELTVLKARCDELARESKFGEALARVGEFSRGHTDGHALVGAADIRRTLKAAADNAYRELVRLADAALAEKDYAKARAALAPAQSFGMPAIAQKAKKKLAEIDSRRATAQHWERWESIKTDAAKLKREGKYDEAIALIETAKDLPLPEVEELAAKRAEALRRAYRSARSIAAVRFNRVFDEQVRPLLAERNYARANEVFQGLIAQGEFKLAAGEVEMCRADVARLLAFWSHLEKRLAGLEPGERVRVAGRLVEFVDYEKGLIRYKMGGDVSDARLAEIKSRDVIAILGPEFPEDDERRLQAALFLIWDKDRNLVKAKTLLDAAPRSPDAQRYKNMARTPEGIDRDGREKAVEMEFAEVEKRAAAQPRRAAFILAGFRAEYGDTRFYNEHLHDMALLRKMPFAMRKLQIWRNRSYLFVKQYATWRDAKSRCEKLGGHLVTITSEDEQRFITKKYMQSDDKRISISIWTGGTDYHKPGKWEWITDEPWEYTAWLEGQPDQAGGQEHWVEMVADKKGVGWNDNRAEHVSQFICEWEKGTMFFTLDRLRELIAIVNTDYAPDGLEEFKERFGNIVSYKKRQVSLQCAVVAILNKVEIPYRWKGSAKVIGTERTQRLIDVNLKAVPAKEALDHILGPLMLTYELGKSGVLLRPAAIEPTE